MQKNNLNLLALTIVFIIFLGIANPAQAQEWLKTTNTLYVSPPIKIGIGTSFPMRSLEVYQSNNNFLRVTSKGGNTLSQYAAGIELRRLTSSGQANIWSLENESTFKIKKDNALKFMLADENAYVGASVNDPMQLIVYGRKMSQFGDQAIGGALSLHSKVNNTTHTLRLDGNQLESSSDFYLNNIENSNLVLANGGGKVKIGTTDNEARVGIAAASDVQLKLINTGAGGGTWRLGASNNTWQAGGGKFIISNSTNTADAALTINGNNSVSIGTTTPNSAYRLSVNGKIRAKEIVVETDWADFVFAKDYKLMPLEKVEAYIQTNKHLPDVPSAKTIETNGVSVGQMEATLLQKVEELTLYLIDLKKENKALAERLALLEK